MHRLERAPARDRIRQWRHPSRRAQPRDAQEHLARRPQLGGARAGAARPGPGDLRRAVRAARRGQDPPRRVGALCARGSAEGARGAGLASHDRQAGGRALARFPRPDTQARRIRFDPAERPERVDSMLELVE